MCCFIGSQVLGLQNTGDLCEPERWVFSEGRGQGTPPSYWTASNDG